jgi:hypothetical protein
MKESQGQLMPNLSGLPGPRPFNNKKKEVKMEDNKDVIDDIVAKTANVIQSGKAFGGWTDNTVKEGKSSTKFIKPSAEQLRTAGSKSKQVGPPHSKLTKQLKKWNDSEGNEPHTKLGPDSSRPRSQQQYTKNINAGVEHKTTFNNLQELPALLPLAARALPMVGRMAMKAIGSKAGRAVAKAGIRHAAGAAGNWVDKQKQANTNASA